MSTIPPPYSFDPKSERRAAAYQAKAARDIYKAQRQLLREQQRHLRRGSILGPILLVTFGVVALLVSTGRWNALNFTAAYSRWWPLLLVLAGAILLAEWAFDQYLAQTAATPPLRRRVGGGIVFLLILIAIFGATSRTVHDQRDFITNGFSINSGNIAEMFGEKHDLAPQVLDETLPPLTPGLTLTVDNPRGDILITGKSNDGNLHITVNKHVFGGRSGANGESGGFWGGGAGGSGGGSGSSSSDSGSLSDGASSDLLTPVFVASPNGISLTVPTHGSDSADLTILVPESLALSLSAAHGDINVTGIKAPINLNAYGDVELQSIAGNVTARLSHTHSDFMAHNITGDLSLRGTIGDLALTDISGQTYLEGTYNGDTHFERLRGPVTFQTSRTHFTLARVDGHVDIDSDTISGDQLVGPVNLRVNSRNINFDNLSGDLDLIDTNGKINITTAKPGNIAILNTNDAISLTIPDRTGLTLFASTTGGEIENDFNIPVTKEKDRSSAQGPTGDAKYRINLQTTHDNITLRKGSPPPITPAP